MKRFMLAALLALIGFHADAQTVTPAPMVNSSQMQIPATGVAGNFTGADGLVANCTPF